ncbi:uncharacterized protein N0V89_008481 [Didymosphaeria variabile]|uniref:Uncharacterized protein n=1 Tax=Didymosphaeria variabile TaxID=1932322 RepID=A0A9W8XHM7_9PLEO|nr:uncharacterized protein N0V89_008481 [Didymosphaeria variabile]KAJ4349862.1 hypothetical protein N0V89_008481 [Didymosphaeria variabile]
MARMLGRSRSFRMLKGGHKETHQRDADNTAPQPTLATVQGDRLKAAAPVTRAEIRVETPEPDMLQRPSTSGGPGDRSTLFHKKVLPVQPVDDPRLGVSFVSPTKSTTTLCTAQLSEEEGIIGIALGSPTMPPQHWHAPSTDFVTQTHGTVTQISSNNQSPEYFPQVSETQGEAPKPKISRWKSIFKKTTPPPRQNKDTFYQLAKAANSARVDSYQDSDSLDSRSLAQEDAANPSPTHIFKSDIRPSRNKQKGHAQPATDTRPRALTVGSQSSGKVKSPLSRFALSPRPQMPTHNPAALPSLTVSATSPPLPGSKPLLDVEIPTVHMERYSVMFSGLLQPQTTNASSSLLQRRQGAADKVKPLNGLSVKGKEDQPRGGMHRRATSPSLPSKSPSGHLSLFPSANTSRAPSPHIITNRPRPLQRSKTAPATSPSQLNFPFQSTKKAPQEMDYPDTPSLSRTSSAASDRSFEYSDSEEITIVATPNAPPKPWRPHVQDEEPVWEIIQRQPSTVTKASALRSHPTSAASPAPQEPTPTSAKTRSPVLSRTRSHTVLASTSPRSGVERSGTGVQATIGVARSVSVSRTTRSPGAVLSPASEGVKTPIRSPDGLAPPGKFLGGNKPLTPTLVELKNRRSQRVQLVDA